MAFFYAHDMPEYKTMKSIYASRVHKFVLDWLEHTDEFTQVERITAWKNISKVKLGNLLKSDSIRPRKYKNKYICFCEIMRPILRAEFPTMTIEEITKIMGKRWKDFSHEKDTELSQKVHNLWQADQERYSREKALSASLGKDKKTQESAYINFCKQQRGLQPKITMLELADRWQAYKKETGLPVKKGKIAASK